MDNEQAQGLFRWIAEQIKPFIEFPKQSMDFYADPANLDLPIEDQYAKHLEALRVFQRAFLETQWDVEKTLAVIDKYNGDLQEAQAALDEAKRTEANADTINRLDVAVKKIMATLERHKGNLYEHQEKFVQYQAYIGLLNKRIQSGAENLLEFRFANTSEILAKE